MSSLSLDGGLAATSCNSCDMFIGLNDVKYLERSSTEYFGILVRLACMARKNVQLMLSARS